MLPKTHRTDKKTLERIFKGGRFIKSQNLSFRFLPGGQNFMASLVVPKSVAKSSVARNRLRRRGYAVLEKYLKQHPIKLLGVFVFGRGSQEFFSGRKKAGYDPVDNMTREITALLSKAEKLL